MAKVRNLIIGCDGTWNDTDESAVTNVVKLPFVLATVYIELPE